MDHIEDLLVQIEELKRIEKTSKHFIACEKIAKEHWASRYKTVLEILKREENKTWWQKLWEGRKPKDPKESWWKRNGPGMLAP